MSGTVNNESSLEIIRTLSELRAKVAEWRSAGLRVGMVPTMGALHEGHISLVRTALTQCDRVVTSVFVNPKQFGPTEDLDKYPRQEAQDAKLLAEAGGHVLWAPSVSEMYPQGFACNVQVGGISDVLEGALRPGHFDGVATVVTKLLLQVLPDQAFFGEKDFQQVAVIRRVVDDLNIPVEIIPCPTIREADGLAKSSRNVYLSAAEREIAPKLHEEISNVAEALRLGASAEQACANAVTAILEAGFKSVDYVTVRDEHDFGPVEKLERPARVLVAARLENVRLIDNIPVTL